MGKKKIHYAWIVLGVAFMTLLLGAGVRFSFGAFVKPLEQEFMVSRATLSSLSFLSFIIYGVTQPIVGSLVDRYGPRRVLSISIGLIAFGLFLTSFAGSFWALSLTFGVVASLGFSGASSVAASVIAAQWFTKNQGLALGVLASSFSLGQMFIVPLSLYIINAFGWRIAYQFFVAILLLIVVPMVLLLLRSGPQDMGIKPYGAGEDWQPTPAPKKARGLFGPDLIRIIKSPFFLYLAIPYFICGFTTSGLIDTHLIPFAQEFHFHQGVVATSVSLLAFFNFFGSIAAGFFSDRLDKGKMLAITYALRVVTILFLLVVHEPLTLMIFAIGFGLVDFATIAPTSALCAKLFSGSSLGLAYGWIALSHQLGAASGSYIPGLLYDLTGGYQASFWLSAGLLVLASFLSLRLTTRQIKQVENLQEACSA